MYNDIYDTTKAIEDGSYMICPNCGRSFYRLSQDWAYKRNKRQNDPKGVPSIIYYCSWGCLRDYEKKREEESANTEIYICDNCGGVFEAQKIGPRRHLCNECKERLKRGSNV